MAENGKDINAAKGNVESLTSQVTELQGQLTERDNQLKELKKSVKDNEALTEKITQLETANQNATTEYQNKIAEIQKAHAIENGVRDAKAKNVKAVIALLDMEKITYKDNALVGLTEQLDALKTAEDSGFLFGEQNNNPTPPAGTKLNNPPAGGGTPPTSGSLAEAVAKALGGNK